MGIDVEAFIAIGAVVRIPDEDLNEKFIIENQEMLDEKYDGYFSEYIYDITENTEFTVAQAGTSEHQTILIVFKDSVQRAEWEPTLVNIKKYYSIPYLEKWLKERNIEYTDIGLLLYPYFSF